MSGKVEFGSRGHVRAVAPGLISEIIDLALGPGRQGGDVIGSPEHATGGAGNQADMAGEIESRFREFLFQLLEDLQGPGGGAESAAADSHDDQRLRTPVRLAMIKV